MSRDILPRIQCAVATGPDMRVPQDKDGVWTLALGRFIGYFELGQHEVMRDGVKRYEDRVHLVFEISQERPEPRNIDSRPFPYFVALTTTLSLLPGEPFFEAFASMNFEGAASHMVELLGEPFGMYVRHRHDTHRVSIVRDDCGYVIRPLKERNAVTGEVIVGNLAPNRSGLRAFVWKTADVDDWYGLYRPGKNTFQEKIASARNWPEHPLSSCVAYGGDPLAPNDGDREVDRLLRVRAWFQAEIDAIFEDVTGKKRRRRSD